ncbi:MAG: apolipoprotein N-acyltransferase [Parachlamydiales bacterium]|nr:apolipoprotein N-acyltransferase [Parachlamydiales bacterium]
MAFSQPAWNSFLGYFASFFGYALFWMSIKDLNFKKRFLFSFIFFFFVNAIWFSWFTSTKYQGNLILLVYLFVLISFAVQFAVISLIATKDKNLGLLKIFAIASIWTVFEYSRLFFMCGFTFNMIGVAYVNNHFSMALASVIGIFGLSFYLLLVNLFGFKAFLEKSKKIVYIWLILALFPYAFGFFYEKSNLKKIKNAQMLNVCLVQTAILPEEKNELMNYKDQSISPYIQWKRIINYISANSIEKIDLIVLPEAALPFGAFESFYPYDLIKDLFLKKFGQEAVLKMPPLTYPYAEKYESNFYVSNSYIAKTLANIYGCEIILGLDDFDQKDEKSYNAAFYFKPFSQNYSRYEKQILVPVAEYIPFGWLKKIAKEKYGIVGSFEHGKNLKKIVSEKNKIAISICYEETHPSVMRKQKKQGAKLFVNLTNDAWFNKSKLFIQHFHHSKIRAVENGIPLIRSCNTGVTAAIDPFGRIINAIYKENEAKAICVKVPKISYNTLYTFWGDYFIIGLSIILIIIYLFKTLKFNF